MSLLRRARCFLVHLGRSQILFRAAQRALDMQDLLEPVLLRRHVLHHAALILWNLPLRHVCITTGVEVRG